MLRCFTLESILSLRAVRFSELPYAQGHVNLIDADRRFKDAALNRLMGHFWGLKGTKNFEQFNKIQIKPKTYFLNLSSRFWATDKLSKIGGAGLKHASPRMWRGLSICTLHLRSPGLIPESRCPPVPAQPVILCRLSA